MEEKELCKLLDETVDEYYEFDRHEDVPEFPFSDSFEKKMNKLIRKEKSVFFPLSNSKIRRVASIVIIVLVISLSTIGVSAVREHLRGIKMESFSDHVELREGEASVNENTKNFTKDTIDEILPEGFTLIEKDDDQVFIHRYYEKGEEFIIFDIWNDKNCTILLDNEHTDIKSYYDADGNEYIFGIYREDNQINVIWYDVDSVNHIITNLPKEDVFDMLGIVQ